MKGRIDRFLERRRMLKVQDRWAALADASDAMDKVALRSWRTRARAMRREIDRVIRAADARLAGPQSGSGQPAVPLGTDWVWRPDLWCGRMAEPGAVALGPRTRISDDVTLYHDCTLPEVLLRQERNREAGGLAPFGLTLEVFGFDGSFLSVATRLPEAAVQGLKQRHLIRVEAILDAESPVAAFARLNIRHGPNTEQLVQGLARGARAQMLEFDLAYARIDEKRVEKMWLDLIFDRPAMNRISLRDVTVSRRPRAEV